MILRSRISIGRTESHCTSPSSQTSTRSWTSRQVSLHSLRSFRGNPIAQSVLIFKPNPQPLPAQNQCATHCGWWLHPPTFENLYFPLNYLCSFRAVRSQPQEIPLWSESVGGRRGDRENSLLCRQRNNINPRRKLCEWELESSEHSQKGECLEIDKFYEILEAVEEVTSKWIVSRGWVSLLVSRSFKLNFGEWAGLYDVGCLEFWGDPLWVDLWASAFGQEQGTQLFWVF